MVYKMRLISYLNEEETTESIIQTIRKDCKPYLNAIKSCDGLLYRGYGSASGDDSKLHKIKREKNRKPKDMYPSAHKRLDKLFREKFGWGVRSEAVFATSNYNTAFQYGAVYVIFPIGKFRYVWSTQFGDLFLHVRRHLSAVKWNNSVPDWQAIVDTYIDKYLCQAIRSQHEICIDCDYYYLVKHNHIGFDTKEIRRLLCS